jgi:hypothetical protein
MAVALWVLGDSEAEILDWLAEHGMVPGGRLMAAGYRARWMLRAGQAEAEGEAEGERG